MRADIVRPVVLHAAIENVLGWHLARFEHRVGGHHVQIEACGGGAVPGLGLEQVLPHEPGKFREIVAGKPMRCPRWKASEADHTDRSSNDLASE